MPIKLPSFRPRRDAYPPDLWTKCPSCGEMLFNKQLDKATRVCPSCGHHFRLSAQARLDLLLDRRHSFVSVRVASSCRGRRKKPLPVEVIAFFRPMHFRPPLSQEKATFWFAVTLTASVCFFLRRAHCANEGTKGSSLVPDGGESMPSA